MPLLAITIPSTHLGSLLLCLLQHCSPALPPMTETAAVCQSLSDFQTTHVSPPGTTSLVDTPVLHWGKGPRTRYECQRQTFLYLATAWARAQRDTQECAADASYLHNCQRLCLRLVFPPGLHLCCFLIHLHLYLWPLTDSTSSAPPSLPPLEVTPGRMPLFHYRKRNFGYKVGSRNSTVLSI